MSRGSGRWGAGLLRWLLPLCVLAATAVAAQGLLRVVSRPGAAPVAQESVSLQLGAVGHPAVALPTPPSPIRPSPRPTPAVTSTPEAAQPITQPVAVYNASTVRGLARSTAAALQQRGVPVAAIGNLPPAATGPAIYYGTGLLPQARTLAQLTGTRSLLPMPAAMRVSGRLVLVVTDRAILTRS